MCLKSTTFNFVLFYDSMIFWLVTENDRSCIRFNYGRLLFNLIILYLHDNYTYICSNPPPKGV